MAGAGPGPIASIGKAVTNDKNAEPACVSQLGGLFKF